MERHGGKGEIGRWLGTIFDGTGFKIDYYQLGAANVHARRHAAGAWARGLERLGLTRVARWLREGARTRELALACRAARQFRADPRLAGAVIRVRVSRGLVRIEGCFTAAQNEVFLRTMNRLRRTIRVVSVVSVARRERRSERNTASSHTTPTAERSHERMRCGNPDRSKAG